MAKVTKEYEWRMQGILYAHKLVKEQGVEALEEDIRMRGFFKTPLALTKTERQNFVLNVSTNLYATTLSVVCMVLHDQLGFGKKRLHRFKKYFDEVSEAVFDFDKVGQHYVTLEDYAVYSNDRYGLGLDVARIAACQDTSSTEKEYRNKADVNDIVDMLEQAGFKEANEWLAGKV